MSDTSRPSTPVSAPLALWEELLAPREPSPGPGTSRGWAVPLATTACVALAAAACGASLDAATPGPRTFAWLVVGAVACVHPTLVTLAESRRHEAASRARILVELLLFWAVLRTAFALLGSGASTVVSPSFAVDVVLLGVGHGLLACCALTVAASFRRRRHRLYEFVAVAEGLGDALAADTWVRAVSSRLRAPRESA